VRWLPAYLASLQPGGGTRSRPIPWMPFAAIDWLRATLRREMSVFEWGSGSSTLFLAPRVGRIVSVEHDPSWHTEVAAWLREHAIENCEQLLVAPDPLPEGSPQEYRADAYTSADEASRGLSFERYVRAIDGAADGSFDLVIVDGRARPSCVAHGMSKVRPGGHLVLDDSDRPDYAEAVERLSGWRRRDFVGMAPGHGVLRQTSAWQRPS
jgi:predicted O-methyltransferase YrrM